MAMPATLNNLRLGILLHVLTWPKLSPEEAAELNSLRPGILPVEEAAELDSLRLRLLPLVLAPPLPSRMAMPAAPTRFRRGILPDVLTWPKLSLEEAAELDNLRPGILPLEEVAELDSLRPGILPLEEAAELDSLRPGILPHVLTWPLPLTSSRTRCWSGSRTPSSGTNCQGTGSSLTALSGTSRILTAQPRSNWSCWPAGRREKICNDSSIDILSEEELGRALRDWKGDYEQWMHPETLRDSWAASQQEWHQLLRRAFRTFLFQLAGSYELTVFFLVAPFSGRNLELFRSSWNSSVTDAEALKKAKDALREAAGSMRWVRGQEKRSAEQPSRRSVDRAQRRPTSS